MPSKKKSIRRTFTFRGETIDRTFTTRALANEWYEAMRKRAERIKAGLQVTMEDVPFKVGAARWVLLRSKTHDYWRDDERKMKNTFVPALGEYSLRSITKSHCEMALHSARHDRGFSDATFNRYRACLHSFFEFLIEEGYRETNPVTKIEIKKESPRGVLVSDNDIAKYLEKARSQKSRWYYTLVVLAMNTGLRPGELLALKWGDCYLEARRLMIRRRYQAALKRDKEGTKGGAGRLVPLNDYVIALLNEYRVTTAFDRPSDYVFNDDSGVRASRDTLNDTHKRVRKESGIAKEIRLYDITRHKFASTLVKETGNTRLAQVILGHSTPKMTERYVHDDPDHVINEARNVVIGRERPVLN